MFATLEDDIVRRVTEHIASFQRSQVTLGAPAEVVMPAARVDDDIKHSSALAALAGALVGAVLSYGPKLLSWMPPPVGPAARLAILLYDALDLTAAVFTEKSLTERASETVSEWITA